MRIRLLILLLIKRYHETASLIINFPTGFFQAPVRILRPFLTRKFFQEILGLEGSKISWEKKHVSYEEIFRQNFLAQEILARILLAEEILKPKISWRQQEILRENFGIT